MKKIFMLALVSLVIVMSSCASIVAPGPDIVTVNSNPSGADVLYNGKNVGKTPVEVEVDRDASANLTLEKEGYNTVSVSPDKVINGWVFGNAIFGAIPGLIVDFIFDNVTKYSVKPLNVTMTQK